MNDSYFLIRYDYRRNFLCLHCRKNVELPNVSQMATKNGDEDLLFKAFTKSITESEKKYIEKTYFDIEYHCPICEEPMIEIPLDFRIPSKRSHLKWKRINSFFKAKGYVRQHIPTTKKAFKKLLEFELECTQNRLENATYFKRVNESVIDAQNRLKKEITTLLKEIELLEK